MVLIDLKPEIEKQLIAQANGKGMPLNEYVQNILERHVMPVRSGLTVTTPEERVSVFREWLQHFPQYRSEPLPNAALSREFYYQRDKE